MKYLIMLFAVISISANASLINGVYLGEGGNLKINADILFNTVEPNGGEAIGTISQGVGRVATIKNGLNADIWRLGDNGVGLYFWFDAIETVTVSPVPGIPGFNVFGNINGVINFFTNTPSLSLGESGTTFLDDKNKIESGGKLFLNGVGDLVNGFTSIATSNGFNNGGSGQFVSTGGSADPRIIPSSVETVPGSGARSDFSFNYSSDGLNAGSYEFSGTADISTKVTKVSEPMAASIFGLGLVAMLTMFFSRRKFKK